TVEGLAAKKLDLVWYGGFTFVQARLRTGNAIPIVQREEDENFKSVFITANPAITKLADLKGKTFTFGSQSSTSGHLMPRFFLLENKLDVDKTFKRVAFSGAHDATAFQVAGGKVDAGALNISVWEKLVADGKVDAAKVKVFYTTPPYYDYNWTVRGDLDPALIKKITDAFLALDPKNAADAAILKLQRATRFVPTRPENYKGIEQAAQAAGLLK
ncbi:MAG: putative selenate ABC transporter substrate-binding protein, partial [Betaproteobacteria bacterium]|nr:putative selenate ABC transporter substrate-binding protein [Betaproteobacteria bacterium]